MKKFLLVCFLILSALTSATAMTEIVELPILVHSSNVIAKATVMKVRTYKLFASDEVVSSNVIKIENVLYGEGLVDGEMIIVNTSPQYEDDVALKEGDRAIFFLAQDDEGKYFINYGFQGAWFFDDEGFYGFAQLKSIEDIEDALNIDPEELTRIIDETFEPEQP
ncbi:MAG: hypothetical protein GX221_05360 [Candidatus Riflebacteria bacterium]|nr:hypothetical protein [Candidatus Riflebacteria bacterium]